jgi:hypothetical protein
MQSSTVSLQMASHRSDSFVILGVKRHTWVPPETRKAQVGGT